MERRGVLKSWDDGKGFGFIQPETGGEQLFVHISAMRGDRRPRAGETVLFVAGHDREGRARARHMRHAGLSLDEPSIRSSRRAAGGMRHPLPKLLAFCGLCALPLAGAFKLPQDGPFWALGGYALFSFVSFLQYWLDKRRAASGRWRIPEASLHAVELLGGWPGALLAQQAFRHKTRKIAYQLGFWGIVLLHQAAWIDYLYFQRLFASAIVQRFLG
ncbi:MAG: hypothetical protein A2002_04120 [Pseudomonadales bacterium GWC1_66_9]|nr:MAG: hypothetical protein A2002_04120 [Pseudomonadales bacterium GWC1_66_9]